MKKITYKGQSKILIALCNLVNELVDAGVSAGDGDMKKSVYDTDGNGIVDNAEKVNGHTVGVNVPENAVFTDTTYTFSQSGSQLTLTDNDGNAQSVNVPSTDTNTTYTMTLDGSKLTLTDSDGNEQKVTLPTSSSGGGSSVEEFTDITLKNVLEGSVSAVKYGKLLSVYINVAVSTKIVHNNSSTYFTLNNIKLAQDHQRFAGMYYNESKTVSILAIQNGENVDFKFSALQTIAPGIYVVSNCILFLA